MGKEYHPQGWGRNGEPFRPPEASYQLPFTGSVRFPAGIRVTRPGRDFIVSRVVRLQPVVSLLLSVFFRHPITLLKLADQAFTLAGNYFEIVIGKFSPLLLGCALHLFPFTAELIRVHKNLTPIFQ